MNAEKVLRQANPKLTLRAKPAGRVMTAQYGAQRSAGWGIRMNPSPLGTPPPSRMPRTPITGAPSLAVLALGYAAYLVAKPGPLCF